MTDSLDYYAQHGAALFPLPAGSKAPGSVDFWAMPDNTGTMRAGSFKKHASTDPKQWATWREQRPGCNFGVVAFASGWIITDTDFKVPEGSTQDVIDAARAEAWQMRSDMLESWGMDPKTLPHVQSASGAWHDYFQLPPHIDPSTLRQPDALKGRINVRVIGYTVAAGSYYDGTSTSKIAGWYQLFPDAPAPHQAPQALIDHCTPKARESNATTGTLDFGDAKTFYQWMAENETIQSDEDWRNAGMAAKLEFGDAGIELWQTLATRSGALDDQSMTRWRSFDSEPTANSVTIKSLMKAAHNAGWKGSVRQSAASMFSQKSIEEAKARAPSTNTAGSKPAPLPPNVPIPVAESEDDFEVPEPCYPEDFGDDFYPPDYLVDGILQRRYCYSLTAQTGTGKTTVALRIAAHVALGKELNGHEVEPGWVLYFAGENPDDVKGRWFGLTYRMGIDPKKTNVIFVYGVIPLSKAIPQYMRKFEAKGIKLSLVIVDTAAAYFEGDNDNDNVQMGNHARTLRSLTMLPGRPCVLVLAHPTKGAQTLEEMTPRGGGAFLNEVDGNIGLAGGDGEPLIAQVVGKFRGPKFNALSYDLEVVRDHPRLVDVKGRPQSTIIAVPIDAAQVEHKQEVSKGSSSRILKALCDEPGANRATIAKATGLDPSTVGRNIRELIKNKLVIDSLGTLETTPKAQKAINAIERAKNASKQEKPAPANLNGAAFPLPARPAAPMPPPN